MKATLGKVRKKYNPNGVAQNKNNLVIFPVLLSSNNKDKIFTMPQSLSSNYIHLTFSTKEREAFFQQEKIRHKMHAYLAGVSNKLECKTIIVGGFVDHVHILAMLNRNISPAMLVKELKRTSSIWFKEQSRDNCNFAWQRGYAIFSVNKSSVGDVRDYISNQEQHHKKNSFQDELKLFLKKHDLDWDEKYLWD